MNEGHTTTEEVRVTGEALLGTVKDLLHQGNIRRLILKNEDGKVLIEIPLTIGVVGAILMPQLAAIGAIAALATHCTIVIVRGLDESPPAAPPPAA